MVVRRALLVVVALVLMGAAFALAPTSPALLPGIPGSSVAGLGSGAPPATAAESPALVAPGAQPDPVAPSTTGVPAPADPGPAPYAPLGLFPIPIPSDSYAPEAVVEMGRIEIPAIGLSSALYDGVTLNNIDRGPSHWPGTALPGHPGNTVVAGHRVTNSHPFRNLDRLVKGDQVVFTVGGVRSVYRVVDTLTVKPSDVWIADQGPASTGTLYACHPPGSQAMRFVVRMELAA